MEYIANFILITLCNESHRMNFDTEKYSYIIAKYNQNCLYYHAKIKVMNIAIKLRIPIIMVTLFSTHQTNNNVINK